jgi:hypothetical protein
MCKKLCLTIVLLAVIVISIGLNLAQVSYPDWSFAMKVWPFDILYPFQTEFAKLYDEDATSNSEIRERIDIAIDRGANVIIFYIDDEQTFETFMDESNFIQTLSRIQFLVEEAHKQGLKVICYLNGLEVIAVGARINTEMTTLARNYPEWLQIDIKSDTMVWYTTSAVDWIPEDSEDAWASPLSPWRDLFKSRLNALGSTGLDGVYIDATFLPGVDSFGIKWASSDPYFETEFNSKYGITIPTSVNWNSLNWRKFIYFRHEVIRDYLQEMADSARANGMTPFFESSSCDYESGTYLGNDVAFTINGGIACSPEIEPEGDFQAAFRMSKATRDANQNFPILFLGWPENSIQACKQFAITLCHSGNYYPTADAESFYPGNAFSFMDFLMEPVLNKRVPYQNVVLIYPMRSKDYTFSGGSSFESYESAFNILAEKHIPFRILSLESMYEDDLEGINHIVLAGATSISDTEYDLIKNKTIALVGTNGTKDEWGSDRAQQLNFPDVVNISSLNPDLSFSIQAPVSSFIEYYRDRNNSNHYFIFIYNDVLSGDIVINNTEPFTGNIYSLNQIIENIIGTTLSIPIDDYLLVIDVLLQEITSIQDNNFDSNGKNQIITLNNSPNPFNVSTLFRFNCLGLNNVTLNIFNISGQKIKTVINKQPVSGEKEILFHAESLPSGIYFARLKVGQTIVTKKIILIK